MHFRFCAFFLSFPILLARLPESRNYHTLGHPHHYPTKGNYSHSNIIPDKNNTINMNNSDASRINITITPSSRPSTLDTTSEAISMSNALYPRGIPIPELGQENTKPTRSKSSGQPNAQPQPLSQEQIQMYRTAICMSELESDAAIQYDDEKQSSYIPNWSLFLPDRETEQKIVKKLDWNLLPLLGILYLFSYLDRVNIGNARLFGLEEAMHLTDGQYNM